MNENLDIIKEQKRIEREITLALDGKKEIVVDGKTLQMVEISEVEVDKTILEDFKELSFYTLEIAHMCRAFQWILGQYKIEPTENEFKVALMMTRDDFDGEQKNEEKDI